MLIRKTTRCSNGSSAVSVLSPRLLRLVGSDDPFRLFLDLERIKKQWFFAQDTRQISKRKKFAQYVLETRECSPACPSTVVSMNGMSMFADSDQLEVAYPKLQNKTDVIRMVINVYRQIQQEAFGIVLINRDNKVD